ncbi:hypothetical protein BRDCF_p53 [Bacteroidales bacterium CF]|jgi:hypothetical protein|nr:hypothetical protein BRDCF_p53 [Bacteroidales bacterium CF]
MKNSILTSFLIILLLGSCQKAEEMKFVGETCAVFGTSSDTLKHIVYSFLEHPEASGVDTILLPVRIMGNRAPYDRVITLSVVDSKSTAVKETHYKTLEKEYIMPADSGLVYIPLIVRNTDPNLSLEPVKLALKIEANSDFGSYPAMQSTIVTFSNTIKKPVWWDYWQASQSSFPEFSVTAYGLVTKVTGRTSFETSSGGDMSLFYISVYSMLNVWTPFFNAATSGVQTLRTWMEGHPGWVLVKHTSDEYYDFYQELYTSTKYKYGPVSAGSSVFGFFDENGGVVSK